MAELSGLAVTRETVGEARKRERKRNGALTRAAPFRVVRASERPGDSQVKHTLIVRIEKLLAGQAETRKVKRERRYGQE